MPREKTGALLAFNTTRCSGRNKVKLDPKTELPDAINICGMTYPIELIKELRADDLTKADGLFSRAPGCIKIEGNLADQERWQTFFHEVIHGWLCIAQINMKDEEKNVDALAYQAYCTLFNTEWKK